MTGSRGVAHENHHGTPRQRLVRAHPSVTEVAPDVREPQPRELTGHTGFDNLQVGSDRSTKEFLPTFRVLFGGSGLKLSPEFTSVPHEGEDGHPAFWAQSPLLHALDELADGRLTQLGVSFE